MLKEEHLIELRKIFLDEAEDLFAKIEECLLALEKTPHDETLINEAFRKIHTLKGSSGMIGSKKVTDFVHNLETIFDYVRAGHQELRSDIIDCVLKSIDHVKVLIVDPDLSNKKDQANDQAIAEKISLILEETAHIELTDEDELDVGEATSNFNTFHIYFKPLANIFENGARPLLLIDELVALGEARIYAHIDLQNEENFDPTECITSWNVILSTRVSEAEINDVFIFIDNQHTVEVSLLAEGNLLENTDFINELPVEGLNKEVLTLDILRDVIDKTITSAADEKISNALQSNASPALTSDVKKEKSIASIRVSADKLDQLMNHVSELVTTQAGLSLYAKNNFDPTLDALTDNFEKLARQLRDIAFEMTLVEIENLFARFHRSVRDISSQIGKSVNFITEGGETELDKTIIESLADPLLHLIRNSLDHGIETTEERVLLGKPQKGTIKLKSFHAGSKVYIQIQDDGQGMDPEVILEKAVKKGLVRQDDELSKKEILELIFVPGFSTATNVTELSGRGVGMDVVRKNVQDMRGEISIESKLDEGTTITIGLPLTLSVIDGLQVRVDNTFYIIPLSAVIKCFEMPRVELLNDFNHVVDLDGKQHAYVDLRREFRIEDDNAPAVSSVILVQNHHNKVGLCVDEIIGEYQAVLKPVGKYYRDQAFVSGATILGDGTVALVLDPNNMISRKSTSLKKEAL